MHRHDGLARPPCLWGRHEYITEAFKSHEIPKEARLRGHRALEIASFTVAQKPAISVAQKMGLQTYESGKLYFRACSQSLD
jgi:hypothetical protein